MSGERALLTDSAFRAAATSKARRMYEANSRHMAALSDALQANRTYQTRLGLELRAGRMSEAGYRETMAELEDDALSFQAQLDTRIAPACGF